MMNFMSQAKEQKLSTRCVALFNCKNSAELNRVQNVGVTQQVLNRITIVGTKKNKTNA